jgi:diacylglycerol kinase family enzyme
MKVGAIINTSSGGYGSESEIEMLDILKRAGVTNCKTWCGKSDQIERAFAEVATQKPEVLVVLGGDGTCQRAVSETNCFFLA